MQPKRLSDQSAHGAAPLLDGATPLAVRRVVVLPLDDEELVAAIAGGAATEVVLDYRGNIAEDMLSADRRRLANVGYALTKTERQPAKNRRRSLVVRVVQSILGVAQTMVATRGADAADAMDSGRVTATYELRSTTHQPVSEQPARGA